MLIAHGPLASLLLKSKLVREFQKLTSERKAILIILALLFGILPDFDFFILIALSKPYFLHHHIITHTPIFWISIYFLGKYTYPIIVGRKDNFIELILKVFLISTLSHMISDMFTGHISLFWPFYDRGFTIFGQLLPTNVFAGYEKHPIFILEAYIVAIALAWLVTLVRRYSGNLHYKVITVGFIAILLPISLIYSQTYNPVIHPIDSRGMPNYDLDEDTLVDALDYDVGNTGKNNLITVDEEQLLKSIEEIKDSRSITVAHKRSGISDKVLHSMGALDSTRYILLSYLKAGKPIIPVLLNENPEFESVEVELRRYMNEHSLLTKATVDQNIQPPRSKIFFLLDQDENIVNLGITDGEGEMLTTIENREVRTFTMEEVVKHYGHSLTYIEYQN